MKRFFRVWMSVVLCGIAILAGGTRVATTQDSQLVLIIDEIDASRYREDQTIRAYVTVRHPQVGAVEGLTANDFTLQISDGPLFAPATAEMETATVSMGIVLELYQTMQRNNGFENAKAAVRNLCLNQKAERDRVAVFSVRQGVDPDTQELDAAYEHPFTSDGGAVANFVQDLQMVRTPPGTPLYDTIVKAMRYTVQVSQEPVGRRGVIVITDGGDRESRNTVNVVVDAARNLRIPIYTIGYTGSSREYDQFLNELANRTGGSYRNTPDSEQFDEFLSELREELAKRYVLTFSLASAASDRQILNVRVDHNNMIGSDSLKFDVEVDTAPPENEATPTTTEEPESTPPDATAAPDNTEGEETVPEPEERTVLEEVLAWVEDNVLYIAIGGALLLLLLIVIIVIIVLLRRKKVTATSAEPYMPPDQGWDTAASDWGTQDGGGSTISGAAGPTAMASSGDRTALVGEPGEAWGAPTPYYPAPSPGPAYPDYGRPQPPQPVQPSPGPSDGGTVLLSRTPKMAHEALLIDRRANRTYELSKPEMRLGRSAENEIPLDSEKVSRRHALIVLTGATFYIQDLGSANGTFVNGNQVRDRVALSNGDEIRLGDQTFLFQQLS